MSDGPEDLLGIGFEAHGVGPEGADWDLSLGVDAAELTVEEHEDGVVRLAFESDGGAAVRLIATPDRLAEIAEAIDPFVPDDDEEAEELKSAAKAPDGTFDATIEGVIAALEAHGGELPQAEFTDVLDTYQSKVSMLLSDMERAGQVERERMDGQHAGKVVRLPDGEPGDLEAVRERHAENTRQAVLDLVDERGGSVRQKVVAETLEWSRSKASQVISDLEADDQLEKMELGRENVISLPEDNPDPTEDEPDEHSDSPDADDTLDLSQYGQTGQVVTPELLIGALEGAQAIYQVKRHLRLADREVEEILRHIGLYEELKSGSGKLDRATAVRHVQGAVER